MVLWKSFKHKAHLARQLSLSDWLVVVEAYWLLLLFYLALCWMSYERLMILPLPTSKKIPNSSHALIFAQQMQRLVGFASRLHLIPMTCLVKSLALQKILCERNIPAQVRIGARKIQAAIYAHAWVEVNGKPIGEADDIAQKFSVLESAAKPGNRQFI
jgi:hypothetical protein